jgi:hypothetical protein
MTSLLWFECEPRAFMVPKGMRGHTATVGPLEVSEYRRRSKVRPYGLRMQAQVQTKEDVGRCRDAAFGLASDLDRIWAYAAGEPLFARILTIQLIGVPEGWRSNVERLRRSLPASRLSLTLRTKGIRRHWMTLGHWPLQHALTALAAYRTADEPTRTLVDLHFEGMMNFGSQPGLVLFAKALELCRALLPGREDIRKQAALPSEVTRALRRSLHWLFGIANQRVEVRHVVKNATAAQLHPRLSVEERRDFNHDADAVIRGVIALRLGLQPAIVARQP